MLASPGWSDSKNEGDDRGAQSYDDNFLQRPASGHIKSTATWYTIQSRIFHWWESIGYY
jgi:hypothetical protein